MWSLIGIALSAAIAAIAWRRSSSRGGFYDDQTYGMTASTHRRYALISLAFTAYFAVSFAFGTQWAGVGGLALYAVIAVFYAASFLRGADEYDE